MNFRWGNLIAGILLSLQMTGLVVAKEREMSANPVPDKLKSFLEAILCDQELMNRLSSLNSVLSNAEKKKFDSDKYEEFLKRTNNSWKEIEELSAPHLKKHFVAKEEFRGLSEQLSTPSQAHKVLSSVLQKAASRCPNVFNSLHLINDGHIDSQASWMLSRLIERFS